MKWQEKISGEKLVPEQKRALMISASVTDAGRTSRVAREALGGKLGKIGFRGESTRIIPRTARGVANAEGRLSFDYLIELRRDNFA